MRMFRNTIVTLGLLGVFNFCAMAGEIKPGSVPGSLNYQGRLERDNAPVSGPVYLTFRIYNVATGGDPAACGNSGAPCRWASAEAVVNAVQGIFNASITPPWSVFANGEALYLEVQVESDVLSPREPLNSVAYAMVAKKLEDGASISVTTLTTTGNVGLGTSSTANRLSVSGIIKLVGTSDGICFSNNTCMYTAGVGTAVGGVTSPVESILESDTALAGGEMIFKTSTVERMRIKDASKNGRIGIGPLALTDPLGTVDIDGSLYVGSQGIYDRTGGSVTVKGLYVPDGGITGANSEYLLLGSENDVIALVSGGAERLRVHSNGNVGIGLSNPSDNLEVAGDIASNTGVRGGRVSMGDYSTWTNLANEVRSETGYHLLLQQTNNYNVGIGTNAPTEKLHVRGNIKADYGVIAATAAFSDSVRVDDEGNFTANSGHGNMVYLSSTVVYGTLLVTGGVGSEKGLPAYLTDNNILTGQNTFTGLVTVSTSMIVSNRVGVGVSDFDFPASKYLQIGDDKPEFSGDDAAAYLVSGSAANSKVSFYRGAVEAARIQTNSGNNLALVINNSTKSVVDSTYYRIYNSVVLISTGSSSVSATTPAVYVSSSLGNIGMGTSILDPNHRLTVAGNIRISGPTTNGLIFADGTTMWTANVGSVGSVSSNDDAVVRADANSDGIGNVVLRVGSVDGLLLNSGGNIGIGTLTPLSRLDVAGDLNISAGGILLTAGTERISAGGVLTNTTWHGNTVDVIYGGTNSDTALSGSSIMVSDGASIVQGNKGTATTVLHGNDAGIPTYAAVALGAAGDVSGTLTVANGGTGLASGLAGGLPYYSATNEMTSMSAGSIGQPLLSNNTGAPYWGTLSASYGGTGLTAGTAGGLPYFSATNAMASTSAGTAGRALLSGGTGAPTWGQVSLTAAVSGTLPITNGGTNSATALSGSSIMVSNGTNILQGSAGTVTTVLHGNASGTPSYSAVSLTADVSGILPATNGGTENGFVKFSGPASTAKTFTLPNQTAIILTDIATVTVAQGGTGLNVGVAGGFPYYSATNAMTSMSAGTAGQALLSGGTGAPTWGTLSASYGGTGQTSYAVGDILYASGTGTLSKLADIATGNALISGGANTAPSYGKIGLTTHVSGTLPIGSGGTNSTSFTASQVIRMNSGGTALESQAGASGTYSVARTTTTTGTPCNDWTFANGVLTGVSGDKACNP